MKIGDKLYCYKGYKGFFHKGEYYEVSQISDLSFHDNKHDIFKLKNMSTQFFIEKDVSRRKNGIVWHDYLSTGSDLRRRKLESIKNKNINKSC